MSSDSLLLFSLDQQGPLVEALVERLGTFLSPHELRIFEDGECKIRPLCDVDSKDIYILATLIADGQSTVHDQLCRLLFFVGALRDAGAGRITVLSPYLCYSRKDRKTKSRDPTTIQYVARLMESMGVERLVTVDVHNLAAFQNAFRIPHAHLEATDLLLQGVAPVLLDHRGENHHPLMVLAPDLGAIKKAQKARDTLGRDHGIHASFGVLYKERSGSELNIGDLIGEVKGCDVLIVDDMIATGSTMERAAEICLGQGATRVMLMATHALLSGDAKRLLSRDVFHSIVVTNTIFHKSLPPELSSKFIVIDIAPLIAHVMTDWHGNGRYLPY